MTPRESAAEAFERFLLTKRAGGVKTKTIETYSQHFHAISKHLDTTQGIEELTADDLKSMIVSMQESGLSPNSIKSYSITLKAFLSWCNSEGITTLNMAKYKGEETIKETYSDEELLLLLQKPNTKKCTFAEYRSWVIVNLLVNCGCRAATVRSILIRVRQTRGADISDGAASSSCGCLAGKCFRLYRRRLRRDLRWGCISHGEDAWSLFRLCLSGSKSSHNLQNWIPACCYRLC